MKDFRRLVRQAIQTGATLPAVIESYNVGGITVRLIGNGPRLTNLPAQESNYYIGQIVLVDYSMGDKPMVRPVASQETTDSLEVEEAPTIQPDDITGLWDEDISFLATPDNDSWLEPQHVDMNVPTIVRYYPVLWDYYYWPGEWDTGGHLEWNNYMGTDQIVVQDNGKYLLQAEFNERIKYWYHNPQDWAGYCQVRILKNDSPIAMGRNNTQMSRIDRFSTTTLRLCNLVKGDILKLEVLQTAHQAMRSDDYIDLNWASTGGTQLTGVRLPGTSGN
jgi:hypothetical protein